MREDDAGAWKEARGYVEAEYDAEAVAHPQTMVFTLLSDTLLRDTATGQLVVNPDAVEAALTAQVGPLADVELFLRGRAVGGFNRKWGLPLPQAPAVQMGSVVRATLLAPDAARLSQLEWQGLGERRAEGFGRVAVDWHGFQPQLIEAARFEDEAPATLAISPEDPAFPLVRTVANRILRSKLDRSLSKRAAEDALRVHRPPQRSQLSRLRSLIQDVLAQNEPNLQRLRDFLYHVQTRGAVRRQFEVARVGEQNLLQWLEQWAADMDPSRWQQLFWRGPAPRSVLGTPEPWQDDALRREYQLRYMDAVLARVQKHEVSGGEG